MPVVLGLAESVSIQSVSLTLQIFTATRHARTAGSKLKREFFTGAMLGLASAVLSRWWRFLAAQFARGVVFWRALPAALTTAAMVGMAMPNLLRMFRRNPQVAAGPIALASADMMTLVYSAWLGGSLESIPLSPGHWPGGPRLAPRCQLAKFPRPMAGGNGG